MEKFPFNDLIDFIATFFKKLLDSFAKLQEIFNSIGAEEETTIAE